MSNIFIIQALLRLLDFASIKKFNLKDKHVDFEDEIGKKAIDINNQLKKAKGLDIFNEKISLEDITKYEHLIGNAMSNHINKKVVLRKIDDEIKILKDAVQFEIEEFSKYYIKISDSLNDTVSKISATDSHTLLNAIKESEYIFILPHSELKSHYFTQAEIVINEKKYFLVAILSHEHQKKENLLINTFFILDSEQYSKFNGNPIQLFLKGLDKYGVDLSINNTLSRFYYWIEVPLNTNIQSTEFLNMQNIDKSEPFSLSMLLKRTEKSIELQDVFAIRTNLVIEEFNNK